MSRLRLLWPYLWAAAVLVLIALDRLLAATSPTAAVSQAEALGCHAAAAGARMGGLPLPLYYASVASILLVSFAYAERDSRSVNPEARIDLLELAWLRALLVHPLTRFAARAVFVAVFALIIAAGLFGNQLPTKNLAPILTWTVWWAGLVLLVLYAGKAWCYVCPWDALAEWAEGLSPWKPSRHRMGLGLRWPRWARNIWPATVLFVALTWLELGLGITMKPRATAWVALAMFAMAFVSAFVFERKSFCRYGCLVGRISGLYAMFSPVEVRVRDREVCRRCSTKSCFRGNAAGSACPTFQYPAVMDVNTYCISCMECVKSCEAGNVGLRLRPWGEDLMRPRRVRSDEAYLALIMMALTGFHGLTMTAQWGRWTDLLADRWRLGAAEAFSLGMVAVIAAPVVLYAGLVWLSRRFGHEGRAGYREHFLRYAYALLPIALFYHLAHNSEHLLVEGPRLLALVSDPFGLEWNLFGSARWSPGPLVGMKTLWAIQVGLVVVGHVYSLRASRRAAGLLYRDPGAALRSQLPMLAAMIAFSLMSLWLLRQPMAMRTTWM